MLKHAFKLQKRPKYIVQATIFLVLFLFIYFIIDFLNMSYSEMAQTYGMYLVIINIFTNVIMAILSTLLMNLSTAMVEIKGKTTVPVMIDEGICNARDMREIIQKRATDKVNIKLMKCGGIYPAVKLAAMAEMAGIECQIGSMVESSIGSAAGFHVAFSKKIIRSVELTGPLKFKMDIGDLKDCYKIPYIQLNHQPGLGIEVNEDKLYQLMTSSYCIE